MTVRVVVVDDHPLFRDGVVTAFSGEEDLEVVGEADDVASAIRVVGEVVPDVVLMDLNLPDASGIDATRTLMAAHPELRVLVMTMSTEDDAVVAAMRAGARGFVVKGAGRRELVESVRAVAGGGAVFSREVADRLTGYFAGLSAVPGREAFPQLSEREREVLELLAAGHDNRGIARRLFLSDKTVRNYVSNLLTKLDVESRSEAVLRARNAGLG
jgi:DNA-binding NarL/FixJ family response regulator